MQLRIALPRTALRTPMTWVRLIGVTPLILGGAVCAQPANVEVTRLESCFRSSRLADANCMKEDDPAQRLACLKKASAAQLECLEHALPERTTASEKSTGKVPSGSPASPGDASPKEPGRTESPGVSTESIPARESDGPPKAELKTNPPSDDVTGGIRLDVPGKIADVPALPAQTNWMVSETTSPPKNRTLVTAVVYATPVVKNGPNTLTIGCRGRRTELSVGMEGDFGPPRNAKPQIDSQINDQPAVRRRWAWSADRKLATYKNNPVRLLQSVPEGATLKITVSDRENVRHEATFQLTGLDPVRTKVATACKWAPVQAKTSLETR
jgi:hypothetical protein